MPIVNEGLQREFEWVTRPGEQKHIGEALDLADELMQEIAYALIIGQHLEVDRLTKHCLDNGYTANHILDNGLLNGMAIVGVKFRDNVIFVPEVLVAARAMKAGMAHIEPILSASGIEPIGTVIMGTVKGDLHDIGKNLCIMMLRGAGLDRPRPRRRHVARRVRRRRDGIRSTTNRHCPPLLTTTMPNMGRTIAYFEDIGLRDEVRFMVGGAPVTREFADEMGADGYGENAVECVETAKDLLDLVKELA